jgi:hypothetical protein
MKSYGNIDAEAIDILLDLETRDGLPVTDV